MIQSGYNMINKINDMVNSIVGQNPKTKTMKNEIPRTVNFAIENHNV